MLYAKLGEKMTFTVHGVLSGSNTKFRETFIDVADAFEFYDRKRFNWTEIDEVTIEDKDGILDYTNNNDF